MPTAIYFDELIWWDGIFLQASSGGIFLWRDSAGAIF